MHDPVTPRPRLNSDKSLSDSAGLMLSFFSASRQGERKASSSYTYHKTGYALEIFERGIEFQNDLHHPDLKITPHPTRGNVSTFSGASRRRLIQLFSRVRHSSLAAPVFLTLTYHYAYFKLKRDFYPDLNVFLQHFRDQLPGWSYIWRLEFQKRGAPHWHLIIWPPLSADTVFIKKTMESLRLSWHAIADPKSISHLQNGFDWRPVESYRKAFSYVSKYTAKEAKNNDIRYLGRRWGYSRNLMKQPIAVIDVSQSTYILLRRFIRRLVKSRKRASDWFLLRLASDTDLYCYVDLSIVLQWISHNAPELLIHFDPGALSNFYDSSEGAKFRTRAKNI